MGCRTPDGAELRAFLGRFTELYKAHRHGAKYFVRRPKDPVLVKQLLAEYEPSELEAIAVELLTTKDEWISGTDRGIGILTVKASGLHAKICERKAKAAQALKPMVAAGGLSAQEREEWRAAYAARMAQRKESA